MANILQLLNNQDTATLLATHVIDFKVSEGDLTSASTGTAENENFSLPVGSMVEVVGARIVTEFSDASDADFNDLTLTVTKIAGAAGGATTLMSAKQIGTSATLAYLAGTATAPGIVTGSDEYLQLTFTPETGKANVNLDGGRVIVLLRVIPLQELGK
jgi:hypothetical protein